MKKRGILQNLILISFSIGLLLGWGAGVQAQEYYGNQFLLTAVSSIGNMDSSTKYTSLRFTAQASKTVGKIRVYLHTEAGDSPAYTYGIQADVGGVPSGTYLGQVDLTATTTGWNILDIPDVTLTAGNVYHIVVRPSGTPTGTNYIALRRSTPLNNLRPYDQSSDANANILFSVDSGTNWTVQGYQPIYVLEYTVSPHEGNPYATYSLKSIYGANWHGEVFTPAEDKVVWKIDCYLKRTGSPADNLYYVLRNLTDSVDVESGIFCDSTISDSYAWVSKTLSTSRTLENGKLYRFYLNSPSSTSTARYDWDGFHPDSTAAIYKGIGYDGTNSYYCESTDSGATWSTTAKDHHDVAFRFTLPFPPTVTLSAATSVEEVTATINGNVTATGGEDPTVTMYWGTTDEGQTPGNWANSSAPTSPSQPQGVAAFYKDVTGLSPGTLYYFSAKATNSSGTSWPMASLYFRTKPDPPTSLASSAVTASTATVSWVAPAAGLVDGYYIRYKVGSIPTSYTDGEGYTTSETSQGLTGLSPNTHYYCKVWSYATDSPNAGGCCDDPGASAECDFTTSVGPPTVTTQEATSVEETTATLRGNVTDTGGENPTRWLDWGTSSGSYPNEVNCGVGGTGIYSTNLTGLSQGTRHYFRARAVNSAGTGTGSELTFRTKPDPPTSFSATTISSTGIALAWTKGDGAWKTKVIRKKGSAPISRIDGTEIYYDTGTSYSDTGLDVGSTYYYRAWSYTETPDQQLSDTPDATAHASTEGEAATKGMMIDEVGWNSAATGDSVVGSRDFIEIYNDSDSPVDISNYYISDGAGADLKWAEATVPAYGFWVIVDGAGTDQTVGNIHYSFEDNKVSGGALELPGTDCAIAISSANTDGFSTNLGSVIDFVAYTDGTNTPTSAVVTDVNAAIANGHWDLYGIGSTANGWSTSDSQPGVIISANFIRRIAYDTPSNDYASHWEASATANIGHTAYATKLVFTVAPTEANAGSESAVFTVERQEAGNGSITTGTTTVNLSSDSTGVAKEFRATPGGGAVSAVDIAGGNSTVDFYYYDKRAGFWTITASATDLTTATTGLTVNPAAPVKLVFTTQPSATAVVGFPFATQPVVSVKDTYDNVITSDNTTQVTLARNVGTGILQGTLTKQVSSGVATYTDVSHDTVETIDIIATSSPSYTLAISNNIVVGANNLPLINITESPVPAWAPGDWEISYTLTDADNHSCSGYPEYSLNGTDWDTATTTPSSGTSIGTPGTKTIIWVTTSDLPTTEDSTVYFRMRAHDGADYGSYGYMGDVAPPGTSFGIDNVAPSGLADFKARSATSTSITFSWAACTETYFNRYEIWYGKDQTKVQNRQDTGSPEGATKREETDINATSTVVTGLTSGNIYHAKIWAVDDAGNEQTISGIRVGLANVQEVSSEATNSELTWTPFTPPTATFYRYRIWYGTNRDDVENRTPPATYWDDSNDIDLKYRTTTSTTITGLSAGTTYYMQLWGIYLGSGIEEVSTPVVTITTPAAAKEEAKSTSEEWGCFIATAAYLPVYPSYPLTGRQRLDTLRQFRDQHLLTNPLGRASVSTYYRISPPIADFIRDKEPLKAVVRLYLKPVVWVAERILECSARHFSR